MHDSVHKSSVPDSYTLFIVKSYLNVLMSNMYICM